MLFVPRLLLILSFAVGPCDPPGDAFGRLGGCGTVGVKYKYDVAFNCEPPGVLPFNPEPVPSGVSY